MGYIALYRKYRPLKFKDVVGQENVTSILKNQIIKNKISHAYIFSGTRGTGKTSSAKIFARAINCENPQNGEPCNKCKSCISILNGENTDVVEMDAASNNSVENIRQIRTEVMYASTGSKYKVYIIDEVHMLTTSAFNALLKTLEEPPENVVFILATTEQHKIPVTILSRCLRFEFLRISESNIKKRLEHVLKEENVEFDDEAVSYIAKLSEGALRDALSILDRCLSENGEKLEISKVKEIIGAVDTEIIDNLKDKIINKDYNEIINIIDTLEEKGKDLRKVIYELTERFLELLTKEDNKEYFANIIDELSSLDADIKSSLNPGILVKASLIKISNYKSYNTNNLDISDLSISSDIENLKTDIDKIKKYLSQNRNSNSNNLASSTSSNIVKSSTDNENIPKGTFKDADDFRKKIAGMGKLKLFSELAGAIMKNGESQFVIITTNEFAGKRLASEKEEIKDLLKKIYSIDKEIVIKYNKVENMSKMEKLLNESGTDYTEM